MSSVNDPDARTPFFGVAVELFDGTCVVVDIMAEELPVVFTLPSVEAVEAKSASTPKGQDMVRVRYYCRNCDI